MATEDPEPRPQTLAVGELVWAKTKGRHPRASSPSRLREQASRTQ